MDSWRKDTIIWLIVLLALSIVASLSFKCTAELNFIYAGTQSVNSPATVRFSLYNNSIFYSQSKNLSVGFSVGMDRYSGAFLHSVSYKASWQPTPIEVFTYFINDPTNRNDDDPNPQKSFQGAVDLTNAPLGNQQIEITAATWEYSTIFTAEGLSYWVYTSSGSSTLNFTIEDQPAKTPEPTFSPQSDILWRTDVVWNLDDSPAQGLWDTDIRSMGRTWTTPIVLDGVLYAGATSSIILNRYMSSSITWINVYAFNTKNGEQLWSYQANCTGISSLAVSDGRVFFGTSGGYNVLWRESLGDYFNALDAKDGKLLWQTPCNIFYASPITYDGKVFTNSDHSILAFDSAEGKILWNYTTDGVIVSAPTIANGVLCVSSYDNTLYALNNLNGNRIWSIKSDNGFSGCLAVKDVVFADSGDGKINAYNAATGNKLWSQNISPPEFSWVNKSSCSTPSYYAGTLYFTGRSEESLELAKVGVRGVSFYYEKTYVYALEVDSHNKIWNFTANSYQFSNPVEATQGVVYTVDNQRILGFNAQNGALIWNYTNADLWPTSQPAVANGYVYIGFSDGQLYAIRPPATGSQPGNQDTTFLSEAKNSILLIIIIVNIAVTITLLIVFRKSKNDMPNRQSNIDP